MSIGKTYKESFQKSIRSLEIKRYGLGNIPEFQELSLDKLKERLAYPSSQRIFLIYEAFTKGMTIDEIHELTFIHKWFLNEMKDKLIHHIIIPDLITPLSRQPSTVSTLIAFLNNLIEEGVVEVHTFAQDFKVDGLNVGIISTITPSILNDASHRWTRMGFLSRMLPVAYRYSQEKAQDILQSITEREYYREEQRNLSLPSEKIEVELPKEYAEQMLPFAQQFNKNLSEAERLYGFRYQKQLQVLLEAHALMNRRDVVTTEDVEVIKGIVGLFGTEEREI